MRHSSGLYAGGFMDGLTDDLLVRQQRRAPPTPPVAPSRGLARSACLEFRDAVPDPTGR